MFKTRFISLLVLLMTAVTGAWADTTVTWEGTKLQGIAVCKGYGTGVTTESMTVDGITITANNGFLLNNQEGVKLMSGAANGVVFSAENNIKSITITSTDFSQFTPDGDFQFDGGSHTYEVSPAATSYGFANGVDITGITKIEITLEGAPAPAGYTVSMKEGTEDATSWTITPAEATTTGVAAGTEVKATYGGMKKVKSVKAKKKAMAPASTPLDNTTTAWADGRYAVPEGGLTYSDAITVSGDVTLVLTDGTTLTLNKGISLAEGATLTIEGTGTMNVNGTNNSTASTVAGTGTIILTSGTLTATGGNGQNGLDYATRAAGGAAINGTVIVDGGTLTAKGGNGGNVGNDSDVSHGGAGGAAISGSVTVNGGTLTATGGNGGNVGQFGDDSSGGAGGAAIGGSLTINAGTVTTTNGAAGSLGLGCDDCQGGAAGKAVAGTVTDNR